MGLEPPPEGWRRILPVPRSRKVIKTTRKEHAPGKTGGMRESASSTNRYFRIGTAGTVELDIGRLLVRMVLAAGFSGSARCGVGSEAKASV